MHTLDELIIEFDRQLQVIQDFAIELSKVKPIGFEEDKLQWTGIGGVIQEGIRNKKINTLLKTIVYNNRTYADISIEVMNKINDIIDVHKEIQKLTDVNDEVFYGNIEKLDSYLNPFFNVWYNICPQLAHQELSFNGENVILFNSIRYYFIEGMLSLETPQYIHEKYQEIKNSIDRTESSGCFGILLFLIGLTSFVGYEIYNYFV